MLTPGLDNGNFRQLLVLSSEFPAFTVPHNDPFTFFHLGEGLQYHLREKTLNKQEEW